MVPALDFNPDRDAARIETAIKTKGMIFSTVVKKLRSEFWNFLVQMSRWYLTMLGTPPCLRLSAGRATGSSLTACYSTAHHFVVMKNVKKDVSLQMRGKYLMTMSHARASYFCL